MTQRRVEVEGRPYVLDPQGIRTSLTDGPSMLWGFQVRVLDDGPAPSSGSRPASSAA